MVRTDENGVKLASVNWGRQGLSHALLQVGVMLCAAQALIGRLERCVFEECG